MADYSWLSPSDWLDALEQRLKWKLDAAAKDPDLLQDWEKFAIYGTLKAMRKQGNDFVLEGKRRQQIREILRPVEAEVIES